MGGYQSHSKKTRFFKENTSYFRPTYPIDVILGFEHKANVYKIYLSVIDHLAR